MMMVILGGAILCVIAAAFLFFSKEKPKVENPPNWNIPNQKGAKTQEHNRFSNEPPWKAPKSDIYKSQTQQSVPEEKVSSQEEISSKAEEENKTESIPPPLEDEKPVKKKWPVLAQIFIALGCIQAIRQIVGGVIYLDIIGAILGLGTFVVYWFLFQFKKWALMGLNIFVALNLINLVLLWSSMPFVMVISLIVLNVLIVFYFNSKKVSVMLN